MPTPKNSCFCARLAIWPIISAAFLACGPETPLEALEANCRQACRLSHAECYGQGVNQGSLANCTETCADDNLETAVALGQGCDEDFADLVACIAGWSCEDLLEFEARSDQPCGTSWATFVKKCPGIFYKVGEP